MSLNFFKDSIIKILLLVDVMIEAGQAALQWRHNERDGLSNHRGLDYLVNCMFRRRSKKTAKFRVTGLCEGNSPVTGEFPAQKDSNAEKVSIWWRHSGDPFAWTNGGPVQHTNIHHP